MTRDTPSVERGGGVWGAQPRPLAGLGGARPPAPKWFLQALSMPMEEHRITVEGAAIEAIAWGDPKHQGILLIHGSMAHARWWQPVAQLLARWYRVVSVSLSGMGGSDWREAYAVRQHAREAMAVAEATGLFAHAAPPAVFAHSFGSSAAAVIAAEHGDRLLGVAMVDSFVVPEMFGEPPPYKARFYPSEAEALERFRFSPDEPGGLLYVVDAIARASVIERDGQWTWRFDPDLLTKIELVSAWDHAKRARCPLAFLRGEMSTVALPDDFDIQREAMAPGTVFVEIPQAYHHIMAEQPITLATTLQAIVEGWRARLSA